MRWCSRIHINFLFLNSGIGGWFMASEGRG
jgi:hypothetical protein